MSDAEPMGGHGRLPLWIRFAPEVPAPFAELFGVAPVAVTSKEPIICPRTDQELSEEPLRAHEQRQKRHRANDDYEPIPPPTPAVTDPPAQ